MSEPLTTIDFSQAKTHLSNVMTGVVRGFRPAIVQRRGDEEMLLLARSALDNVLRAYRLEPTVTMEEGEVTTALDEFGMLGFGTTLDEALDDLVERLREHTSRFFDRAAYYTAGPLAWQAPYLLRFALTPPDRQRHLLTEAPPSGRTASDVTS